jgi:hypothetical protein
MGVIAALVSTAFGTWTAGHQLSPYVQPVVASLVGSAAAAAARVPFRRFVMWGGLTFLIWWVITERSDTDHLAAVLAVFIAAVFTGLSQFIALI